MDELLKNINYIAKLNKSLKNGVTTLLSFPEMNCHSSGCSKKCYMKIFIRGTKQEFAKNFSEGK